MLKVEISRVLLGDGACALNLGHCLYVSQRGGGHPPVIKTVVIVKVLILHRYGGLHRYRIDIF